MRKPRIEYPGATYHVICRGNNQGLIYMADCDRFFYLENLKKAKQAYNFRLFFFCLMNNHVHLGIRIDVIPLSKIMHAISSGYAKYFNRQHSRIGHLFQDRYKAIVIKNDAHFLEAMRYVHLNPSNSGVVQNPSAYFWSSHNCYLDIADDPLLDLVDKDEIMAFFGKMKGIQRKKYRKFIEEGIILGKDRAQLKREIERFREERGGRMAAWCQAPQRHHNGQIEIQLVKR